MKPYLLLMCSSALLIAGTVHAEPKPYTPPVKRTFAPSDPGIKAQALPPAARIEAANRAALREPASENYLNAIQTYAYMEGALFRVYTAPDRVTDLMLEPTETLIAISAGDTARWIIGDTKSGEGENARTHILIKPHASGLKTNLVVTTDRRAYHLQLESTPSIYMAAVAWHYPQMPVVKTLSPVMKPEPLKTAGEGISLASLRFSYDISGDRPAWRPVRVFDDGTRVYIAFPPDMATTEAPPLFGVARDGTAQLVNYRLKDGYYIVDHMFDVAELRSGTHPQTVVRIKRLDASASARGVKTGARHD